MLPPCGEEYARFFICKSGDMSWCHYLGMVSIKSGILDARQDKTVEKGDEIAYGFLKYRFLYMNVHKLVGVITRKKYYFHASKKPNA